MGQKKEFLLADQAQCNVYGFTVPCAMPTKIVSPEIGKLANKSQFSPKA
jgi:hypothetical protein